MQQTDAFFMAASLGHYDSRTGTREAVHETVRHRSAEEIIYCLSVIRQELVALFLMLLFASAPSDSLNEHHVSGELKRGGRLKGHLHFVMWASVLILAVFLFDGRFEAELAVGMSAHREEAGRVAI